MTCQTTRRELGYTYILQGELPAALLDQTLKMTERLLAVSSQDRDYSRRLAGRFESGRQCSVPRSEHEGSAELAAFLNAMGEDFVARYLTDIAEHRATAQEWVMAGDPRALLEQTECEINDMWVVSQRAGDYNPPHRHFGRSPCMLSGIVYLKIPPAVGVGDIDGTVRFSWGQRVIFDISSFTRPEHWVIKPQEGLVLLFPAHLVHEVFPFRGDDERRSLSFNINVWCSAFPFLQKR